MYARAELKQKGRDGTHAGSSSGSSGHAARMLQTASAGTSAPSPLQTMLNNSPAAVQLRKFQETADRGPQVRRLAQLQTRMNGRGNAHVSPSNAEGADVVQGVFVYKDVPLTPYLDKIKEYLETYHDKKVVTSFHTSATSNRNYKFDKWADGKGVDWKDIFISVIDFDPAWEPEIFETNLTGHPLSGYYPPGNLEKVPRSGPRRFDYTASEDLRVLQLLRQLSTQLYLSLQNLGKLAENEQEIQMMWTHGNLLIASNQNGTTAALFTELNTLSVGANSNQKLYSLLTAKYVLSGKSTHLTSVSSRHAQKIANLYTGIRELQQSPKIQAMIGVLIGGDVKQITDVKNDAQVKDFADNSGNIYILSAASPEGFSHAEQRLIEFRDVVHAYQAAPEAWVAGKKRPCFGCWIREVLVNASGGYKLFYQEQPGKAFLNTYRAAPPKEKKEWHTRTSTPLKFYESEKGGGEIGPESDSEAEESIGSWSDADDLAMDIGKKVIEPRRKAIKRHFDDSGADFEGLEKYLSDVASKKRKIDPTEEQKVQASFRRVRDRAKRSRNPALRRVYKFNDDYTMQS